MSDCVVVQAWWWLQWLSSNCTEVVEVVFIVYSCSVVMYSVCDACMTVVQVQVLRWNVCSTWQLS